MSLKFKLTSLFFLTLLLALAALAMQLVRQSARLSEHQCRLIESVMLAQKKSELVRSVASLRSQLAAAFPAGTPTDPERAKSMIAAASAGPDGYFFLYDREGRCLVHPRQPELVGQNLQSLVDTRGRHVIPSLIETARSGGGFQRYSWNKPSTGKVTEKLGYVSLLEPWGWVVGTGVYLEDVEAATRSARASAQASIESTLRDFALVALLALVVVFVGGLAMTVTEQRLADRKLRTLADRIVHLQEDERSRVARDLHDGIVQVLVSARFLIEAGRQKLESNQSSCRELFDKSLHRLDEAVADVRRIAHDLRPASLDDLGLASALNELMEEAGKRLGVRVAVRDGLGAHELGTQQAVALLRVAQEALLNVERHAQASEVSLDLSLASGSDRVVLRIVDDGHGFDPRMSTAGCGLGNMRHRIEELGGQFRVESRRGRTEISAELDIEG